MSDDMLIEGVIQAAKVALISEVASADATLVY